MPNTFDTTSARGDGLSADVVKISLGPPLLSRGWALFFMWLCGLWAAINVGFFLMDLTLWPLDRALVLGFAVFLPWLPFLGATLLFRAVSRSRPAIEFSDERVVLTSFMSDATLDWEKASRLYMPRKLGSLKGDSFPVGVVLERRGQGAPSAWDPPVAIRPSGGRPETLDEIVTQFVRHVPPRIVDPEIVLFLGLARRIVAHGSRPDEGGAISHISPFEHTIMRFRQSSDARFAAIVAPVEYFMGQYDKALAMSTAGLSAHAGDWELLLCAALCHKALGDDAASRAALESASATAPPADLKGVLAAALARAQGSD